MRQISVWNADKRIHLCTAYMECMPAILELGRLRQENQKFKAFVDYMRIPFPKNKQKSSKDKTASSFLPLARRHRLAQLYVCLVLVSALVVFSKSCLHDHIPLSVCGLSELF